LKFFLICNHL